MPLYFAYGSCMNQKDLRRTIKKFKVIGPATLHDYRFGFTRYSAMRRGGVADIIPHAGAHVEGILFDVPDFAELDIREGSPHVYRRIEVDLELKSNPTNAVRAYTYEVVHKAPRQEFVPSDAYASLIFEAATALSPAYQQFIKDWYIKLKRLRLKKYGHSRSSRWSEYKGRV